MIELRNVSKTYRTGKVEVPAVRDVSLKISPGEFVAIMGPSGSGKSTLLNILGLLDKPDSGSYFLGQYEVSKLSEERLAVLRNNLMGFVFQMFHLLPRINSLRNVELPLIYAGKSHFKEKAREKLKEVGLSHRDLHMPNELSGGEQQRVAIARALVNEPLVILADEPTGNLDSKSQDEVVTILEDLNRKGKTIIMVTHEEEVARHAKRIIKMRDGKIVSDEIVKPLGSEENIDVSIDKILSESHSAVRGVELFDHIKQAFSAIMAHKMRSILSILGILIGVCAVISMMALGEGAKVSIETRLRSMGSNLLTVRSGSHRLHGIAMEAGAVTRFTFQDVEDISKLVQVKCVSPQVAGRAQVVYGNKNWNTQVLGTGVHYATMRSAIPEEGRFFTEDEVRARKKVAVVGKTVARELFGENNPVGISIRINKINFKVIGVLPEKGMAMWRDQDDVVVIPITTAMYRLLGKEYIDSIDVEVIDVSFMDEAEKAIKQIITKRHRLNVRGSDTFEIRNMVELQETLKSTTKTMTWLLGAIAAISLLVGGIGIMNIMLVSVTERTKEIGLRKAIGARRIDVLEQFLIESIILTFSGGIMGILAGMGVAFMFSHLAGWITSVSIGAILLACSFSIIVGLVFGLWPASQAARLNPIEALRYE